MSYALSRSVFSQRVLNPPWTTSAYKLLNLDKFLEKYLGRYSHLVKTKFYSLQLCKKEQKTLRKKE